MEDYKRNRINYILEKYEQSSKVHFGVEQPKNPTPNKENITEIKKNMYYTKRLIAFVDILGFKSKVDESLKSEESAEKLHRSLKRILQLKKDNDPGAPLSLKDNGLEVTTFSDSAVISYDASNIDNLLFLIMHLIHLQLQLAIDGVLLRGGLTIGNLYHDGEIVCGPAMNNAYQLESEIANYPRIIVDIKAIEEYVKTFRNDESSLLDLQSVLRKDEDGCYYIDMLCQDQELSDYGDEYYSWLSGLRPVIIEGLKIENIKVKTKYEWLRTYFNEVVTDADAYYPVPQDEPLTGKSAFRISYNDLKID